MKRTAFATIALLAFMAAASFRQAVTNVASPNVEVFVGTSPCADFLKAKLQIPAAENCDRIQWQISLYDSSKYELTGEYGYHVDNRTYLKKGRTNLTGTWTTAKGRAGDPNGVVVQIDRDQPRYIAFALIDQNLLHLLDPNKHLAVGDSGASYTLSRHKKASALPTGSLGPRIDSDEPAATNFSGRSPCQEIARELNRRVAADCSKLKWTIDFYRDPQTLAPTTYQLRGSLYRDESRGTEQIRKGNWKVIRGTKTDPNAVVYQLEAFESDGPIFLLKADRDILFFLAKDRSVLVGDKDFGYTLNRGEFRKKS